MPPLTDLTNQLFGRLTVIRRAGTDMNKKPLWLCRCSCGKQTLVPSQSLKSGATKSCGCLQEEHKKAGNIKHGLRYTRVYKIWLAILQRTGNEKNTDYELYGGRGITVCDEWKNDFMAFYNWAMENGYQENLTIDRIEVNGNYEPSNCRWSTQKEQCNNTRRNRRITLNGKTMTLKQWEEETGINSTLITARIDRLGWSEERALTEPVKKQKRRNDLSTE